VSLLCLRQSAANGISTVSRGSRKTGETVKPASATTAYFEQATVSTDSTDVFYTRTEYAEIDELVCKLCGTTRL